MFLYAVRKAKEITVLLYCDILTSHGSLIAIIIIWGHISPVWTEGICFIENIAHTLGYGWVLLNI